MDDLSRRFINQYQGGFPICEHPYARVAAELDTDEEALIHCLSNLLSSGLLSRFGPLYNALNMGGGLTLAALSAPEEDFAQVTLQVNSFPEVAHNYQRVHDLNMWFVIATETPQALHDTITAIEQTTGLRVYNFPKLQTFYLGLWLELDELGRVSTKSFEQGESQENAKTWQLDELDRNIIEATQTGLPLVSSPYQQIASELDCSVNTLISRMQQLLENGVIRRIGVIPNHYKLGLKSNGMSVWDVPDSKIKALGDKIGELGFVSHCYERPRCLPIWPYNLFAMVHGQNRNEVNDKVDQIAQILGDDCQQHEVLLSTAILKKSGLRLVA